MRPSRTAVDRRLRQRLGVDVPLVGQDRARSPRPNGRRAAPCGCVGSIFSSSPSASSARTIFLRAAKRSSPCSASVSSSSATPARHQKRRVVLEIEPRLDVEHVDERQFVAPADLEIVEVVRRRDLHRAGALLRIGILVGDDRNAAADERQDRVLADQMR